MTVFATYNIKGGVGKTAAAVNLAYYAAQQGRRTLLWDLDPQGAASYYYRVRPESGGGKRTLKGKQALEALIRASDFPHLDLLPANFSFRHLDVWLDDSRKPETRLSRRLAPLLEHYDCVFLDCAPTLSLASESIFHATDVLLIPLIPTTLSLRAFEQLQEFLNQEGPRKLRRLAFFSMADRRKNLHLDIMSALPGERPEILGSVIPQASEVERMGPERAPLGRFAASSKAARAYQELWQEICQRLALAPP